MILSNAHKLWLAFLVPLIALLLHSFYYAPFFVDDAYISLRYAQRLIEGKGLTWNDGYYVEGYSNLLWVLLVALLGWCGFNLVAAAKVVCLLASVATMLAFCRYTQRIAPDKPIVMFLANIAFAFCAPVAVWSVGGLEGTLIMALLAWAWVIGLPLLDKPDIQRAAASGVLLGLVCITRPEGAVFTMATAGGVFLFATGPRIPLLPSLMVMCGIAFLFFATQIGFRLAYYGEWLPNTYYAKVSGPTYARLLTGYMYSVKAIASFLPLLLVVCLQFGALLKPEKKTARNVVIMCLVIMLAWLGLLTSAGGDMEPSYRHILPVVPLMILMMVECIAADTSLNQTRKTGIFYSYILLCFLWLQHSMEENDKHFYAPWEAKITELGKWLNREYGQQQPLMAATHVGALSYYSRLPVVDMLGLNDTYMTKHRGELFGHGLLGHELFDANYILSRKPDLIVLFTGREGWLYSKALNDSPEFKALYHLRTIELPSYTPEIWVRNDSAKMK
jgi:arabinofuranosyltransferase